jgi:hypothetical protein
MRVGGGAGWAPHAYFFPPGLPTAVTHVLFYGVCIEGGNPRVVGGAPRPPRPS